MIFSHHLLSSYEQMGNGPIYLVSEVTYSTNPGHVTLSCSCTLNTKYQMGKGEVRDTRFHNMRLIFAQNLKVPALAKV